MPGDAPKVTVKANVRILKFAEGSDHDKDDPFEVIEKEMVFEGEEAVKVLQQAKEHNTVAQQHANEDTDTNKGKSDVAHAEHSNSKNK